MQIERQVYILFIFFNSIFKNLLLKIIGCGINILIVLIVIERFPSTSNTMKRKIFFVPYVLQVWKKKKKLKKYKKKKKKAEKKDFEYFDTNFDQIGKKLFNAEDFIEKASLLLLIHTLALKNVKIKKKVEKIKKIKIKIKEKEK